MPSISNTQDQTGLQGQNLSGTGPPPTVTPGTAAGTGATASASGDSLSGIITLTTGVSVGTTGIFFTLTPPTTFKTRVNLLLAPGDSSITSKMTSIYIISSSGSLATVSVSGIALALSTTYTFTYLLAGNN